jgi:hypothetical protein
MSRLLSAALLVMLLGLATANAGIGDIPDKDPPQFPVKPLDPNAGEPRKEPVAEIRKD